MHYLLIHSPLVTKETWLPLIMSLEAAGFQVSMVTLDNNTPKESTFFGHHRGQIESSLAELPDEKVIAVAHSGAGNLLALLDPDRFEGHVFLDAIFPVAKASRFELFDDPDAVEGWQQVASKNAGLLPRSMLTRFGEEVEDSDIRKTFVADIVDVPIALYEEAIPVHPNWPRSNRGLYVLWTETYAADATRADAAGFEVRRDSASHFKMLNQPDEVARELAQFARANE